MQHATVGRLRVGAAAIVLSGLVCLAPACGESPTSPSPPVAAATPTVSSIAPSLGPADTIFDVRILGSGFRSGAAVTLGVPATNVVVVHSGLITATAPRHAAGTVDVVVTNPDGRSGSLNGSLTFATLAILSVSPRVAFGGGQVTISGAGFLAGATVTIGGAVATVLSVIPTAISATFPSGVAGAADVVVTNPDGQSVTLPGALTVLVVSLTASPAEVGPGGQVTVRWSAPGRENTLDWIGLYRVGTGNLDYGWWEYVANGSGTFVLGAPAVPGEYEFRYLLDDGFVDAARSNRVTVRAGG